MGSLRTTMQGCLVRKWIALLGLAALQGCGDGPTAPTPDFVGNYTLVVEASTVCELSAERYTWELVGTSAGSSESGGRFLLVLPGGNPSVSVNLNYGSVSRGRGGDTRQVFNTSVNIQAPVSSDLRVRFNGSSRGTASVAADGRGQVVDGTLSGLIELTDGAQRPPQVATCTAADHRWTLTPH